MIINDDDDNHDDDDDHNGTIKPRNERMTEERDVTGAISLS